MRPAERRDRVERVMVGDIVLEANRAVHGSAPGDDLALLERGGMAWAACLLGRLG